MLARDPSGNPRDAQLDAFNSLKVAGAGSGVVMAVNIAIGTRLSPMIDLGGARLAGIVMPAAWDAADLTFQAGPDGAAWNDVYDSTGVEYTVKAAASRTIIVPLADLLGMRYLKIRSGKSAAGVDQTAARALTLLLA